MGISIAILALILAFTVGYTRGTTTEETTKTKTDCAKHNSPEKITECAAAMLSGGLITPDEFNTYLWTALDYTDKDTRAYVIGIETKPSYSLIAGKVKHVQYTDAYRIPLTLPFRSSQPTFEKTNI